MTGGQLVGITFWVLVGIMCVSILYAAIGAFVYAVKETFKRKL